MKLMPVSASASSSENDAFSSTVQPKTLPPKASGETWMLDVPRVRSAMFCSDIGGVTGLNCAIGQVERDETTGCAVRFRRCRRTPDILADRFDSCRQRVAAMMDGLRQMTDASSVKQADRTAAFDPALIFVAAMRHGKRDAVSAESG